MLLLLQTGVAWLWPQGDAMCQPGNLRGACEQEGGHSEAVSMGAVKGQEENKEARKQAESAFFPFPGSSAPARGPNQLQYQRIATLKWLHVTLHPQLWDLPRHEAETLAKGW